MTNKRLKKLLIKKLGKKIYASVFMEEVEDKYWIRICQFYYNNGYPANKFRCRSFSRELFKRVYCEVGKEFLDGFAEREKHKVKLVKFIK